jgi:hypothetical protein
MSDHYSGPTRPPTPGRLATPRDKAELLALIWGECGAEGSTGAAREAHVWWIIKDSTEKQGLERAVKEFKRRKLFGLEAIVQAFLDGKRPSEDVLHEMDKIEAMMLQIPAYRQDNSEKAAGIPWPRRALANNGDYDLY